MPSILSRSKHELFLGIQYNSMDLKTYKYYSYPDVPSDNFPNYHIAQKPTLNLEIKTNASKKVYFIKQFVKQMNTWVI